jgi:hypothetical protein
MPFFKEHIHTMGDEKKAYNSWEKNGMYHHKPCDV